MGSCKDSFLLDQSGLDSCVTNTEPLKIRITPSWRERARNTNPNFLTVQEALI